VLTCIICVSVCCFVCWLKRCSQLDHHCPWTGKCVGGKTLMAFYWFLFTLLVHIIYVAAVSLYYISYYDNEESD
jgi:hypothetical protein